MKLKNLAKTTKLAKTEKPATSVVTKAGTSADIGTVLRVLMSLQDGDRIEKKCGAGALSFVQETQKRAEQYGERLSISPKQWIWLKDIAEKVRR